MSHLDIHSPSTRKLIVIITSSFLVTFAAARLFVYLVLGHLMPDFFLTIKGVHIHHFTYGVFILAIIGLYFILERPEPGSKKFKWATLGYGVGLGLTFDEFGMWIRLEDGYWVRQSYDAVIIITLILLNIAYHKTLFSLFKELGLSLKKILKI
jgi:hypothetical protein